MASDPQGLDGPSSHSELLKVDYDRVMIALYRAMKRFGAPGINSGIPEYAALVNRNASSLHNQFGPTSYDHAPTVHAFLQAIETLKPRDAVQEIAALADCVTIPRSPRAQDVGASANEAQAWCDLANKAGQIVFSIPQERGRPLTAEQREQVRERLLDLIAYAAHLLTRIK